MSTTHLLVYCAAFAALVFTAEGLKCQVCTSGDKYEGDACFKAKGPEDFLVDCNEKYGDKDDDGNNLVFKYCRIQSQTINKDHILSRDCARDGELRCVERAGTKGIQLTYCECEGDNCNGSASVFASTLLILTALAAALFSRS